MEMLVALAVTALALGLAAETLRAAASGARAAGAAAAQISAAARAAAMLERFAGRATRAGDDMRAGPGGARLVNARGDSLEIAHDGAGAVLRYREAGGPVLETPLPAQHRNPRLAIARDGAGEPAVLLVVEEAGRERIAAAARARRAAPELCRYDPLSRRCLPVEAS